MANKYEKAILITMFIAIFFLSWSILPKYEFKESIVEVEDMSFFKDYYDYCEKSHPISQKIEIPYIDMKTRSLGVKSSTSTIMYSYCYKKELVRIK